MKFSSQNWHNFERVYFLFSLPVLFPGIEHNPPGSDQIDSMHLPTGN